MKIERERETSSMVLSLLLYSPDPPSVGRIPLRLGKELCCGGGVQSFFTFLQITCLVRVHTYMLLGYLHAQRIGPRLSHEVLSFMPAWNNTRTSPGKA